MKCTDCVYYPKCGERPFKEDGCADFKDCSMFVELPFSVYQLLYYIEPASKYVPVVIDGEAYFKLVDDSEIKSHFFDCGELKDYLPTIVPGCVRERRKYYTTKKAAEEALEEVRNRGREKDVRQDDN